MRTFSATEYLKMDIAANFGLDRATWDERLSWFNEHRYILWELLPEAKEPSQYFAAVTAWEDYMGGKPIGYACSWDASASGIQLLSLLAGCKESAKHCNLIDTGAREDVYTTLYEHMCQVLGSIGKIPRKDVKKAAMTHMYQSRAVPKRVFGDGTPELAQFYASVDALLPGANKLNYFLAELWQPETLAHCWTLPDGFEVVVKVMDVEEHNVRFLGQDYPVRIKVNKPMPEGLSLSANVIHSIDGMVVREMNRRCNYGWNQADFHDLMLSGSKGGIRSDRKKDLDLLRILELHQITGFLSAVVFEYLDPENIGHLYEFGVMPEVAALHNSLPPYAFPVLCIHDAFKAHPNNGNHVRQQYINILSELARSRTLDAIVSEIINDNVTIRKMSDDLHRDISDSEYPIS